MGALANWSGSILGSARGSRAGDRVLAIANFYAATLLEPESDGFGEAAETSTRAACAPQNRATTCRDCSAIDLLAMPRLRNVLNPWLADVIHQHEGQSVCVWPAELIHARAFAIFGDLSLTGESPELSWCRRKPYRCPRSVPLAL